MKNASDGGIMKKIFVLVTFLGLACSFSWAQQARVFALDTSQVLPGGSAHFMYGNQVPSKCTITAERNIICPNNIVISGALATINNQKPTAQTVSSYLGSGQGFYLYLRPAAVLNTQPITIAGTSYPSIKANTNCLVPLDGTPMVLCNDGTSFSGNVIVGGRPALNIFSALPTSFPGGEYLGSTMQAGALGPTYYFWILP